VSSVRVIASEAHKLHVPQHDVQLGVPFEIAETPERIERILQALGADQRFSIESPTEHGRAPIEAVHAPGLIDFLEQPVPEHAEWIPDTFLHPALRDGLDTLPSEPTDIAGRLGQWCFDTGTPLVSGTYPAARAAVDVCLTAADLVLDGERVVFGAARPPGHHATRSAYGGFCYFNNAAITAEYLVRRTGQRVAVLDLDYHHGNGTQQIFYRRAEVVYVSLHADPARAYPYFCGYADETGAGPGLGATLNIPLPAATSDAQYLDALNVALAAVQRCAPDVTVISLGMDTYGEDPLSDFALTTDVYAECGRRVGAAIGRGVILQEGGYHLPTLGENVRQFLRGLGDAQ
jgi:acetoin utilization deacetylase AcuC-like enzyme